MSERFAFTDEFGPEKVIELADPRSGLRAILVVDNTAAGPSIGGCRMAPDVTDEECFRLARAMTFKNAAAGLPHGGGKLVIIGDPAMPGDEKEALIRSLARAIGEISSYIPGPDMGTDETAMAWIRDEIGRAVGLPREIGGIPLDEIGATGFGLSVAMRAAHDVLGVPLDGARVAIQGYGAVGRWTAHHLAKLGAVIVAVSDSRGGIIAADGLDLGRLDALKAGGQSVADYEGARATGAQEVLTCACDILVPAARPDVINDGNAGAIKARLVLEGANIPATAAAEDSLHARGVWVVPDFIANAGGVICAAVEYRGGAQRDALSAIEELVYRNTAEVLTNAKTRRQTPRAAALALAQARVRTAMRLRR
ncbi:Glu/Leu/Phe/Val dehydrogenase [Actibacterium sp. MT2.3-13A]|uniref:Glu/Leu/Phe/Val family dehydrogenase n=1 Tax=Actibacterium sp. MT2.3-13A TaxID=2828332 RepID=UPI001BA7DE5C|nr:Glu/Leu/Phe/Val dehydrogenase [Actibacterium sp. MT2.3-13A]